MKAPVAISAALALAAVEREAAAADVELLMPGSGGREAVLLGLGAVNALSGTAWDLAYARQHVSTTLPGVGSGGLAALALIPVAGPILAAVASSFKRTTVSLSPSALAEGRGLCATWRHEAGHVGSIARGGFLWCAAYGLAPEVRAGGEAPCFGSDIAHAVHLGGMDVDVASDQVLVSLGHYGLDEKAMRLARGIILSIRESVRGGADPGDVVADTLTSLRAVGWVP